MDSIAFFNKILQDFNIKAICKNYQEIDNYYYYDIQLIHGGKVNDLKKYQHEIALALKCHKPTVKILHDQGLIRFEFHAIENKILDLKVYINSKNIKENTPKGELICLLGQRVDGTPLWMNLQDNPHMIIAGTTGSGKTVLLHNIIANLYHYNNPILYLIDPKHIEFSHYQNMPNTQVKYTYHQAISVLDELIQTMNDRYEQMIDNPDIQLSPIVLMIDEFADLILQDENNAFYQKLCRLAQKCRAAKMYIILATQRPSVDIINGTIKANFPARIACKTASQVDSRVILDKVGAEHLKGKGDALLTDNFRYLERFQVAYINPKEVVKLYG